MLAITASGKYDKGMYTYWVYKGIRVMQILCWYNLNLYNYTGTTFTHTVAIYWYSINKGITITYIT